MYGVKYTSQVKLIDTNLEFSCWIPYWTKEKGIPELEKNLAYFQTIRFFSFEVDSYGCIKDPMHLSSNPYLSIWKKAQQRNIKIIPTVMWGNRESIHVNLSDTSLMHQHVDKIFELIKKYRFDGIDIDYEGKSYTDILNFNSFIAYLSNKLHLNGKLLICTVEARCSDSLLVLNKKSDMAFANDYRLLDSLCDKITVMAYDQWFQTKYSTSWVDSNYSNPPANCDTTWLKKIIKYTLNYIRPEKLEIGLPNYGWQFSKIKMNKMNYYKLKRSLTWDNFVNLSKNNGQILSRSDGGEAILQDAFSYSVITDSASFANLFKIVYDNKVSGVSIFKMDGQFDSSIYKIFELKNKECLSKSK